MADKLLTSFGYEENGLIAPASYPDYYGGVIIDDNSDLVIYVTEESDQVLSELNDRIGENKFKTKFVKNSFGALTKLMNDLNEELVPFYSETAYNDNKLLSHAWQIDDFGNKVIIDVKKEELIDQLLKRTVINDSDLVAFRITDSMFEKHADLWAGSSVASDATPSTAGYRARRTSNTSQVGLVCSGHAFPIIGSSAYIGTGSSQRFGSVYNSKQSGFDASFCLLDTSTGHTVGNTIYWDYGTLSTSVLASVAGNSVRLVGRVNRSNGNILSTNQTVGSLTNQVIASYTTQPGDSGGLVYYKGTSNFTVGINFGTYRVNGVDRGVYAPASVVNSGLGVQRY